MKRAAAIAAALLVLAVLLVALAPHSASSVTAAAWTPTRDIDGAGARCDTATAADVALTRLGEHHVAVFVRPQADLDAVVPAGAAGYAEPTPDGFGRITLTADQRVLPCRYVWSTIAHEWTHVLQYRACGGCDLYAGGRGPHAEIVADCGSVLTGWPDYWPYLTDRANASGRDGCSSSELAEAKALRRWTR
ncbi:hypothetical protein [Amycolatopsis sp. NBC_00438]|uniref:hypothetical protein n=1 Tax=Amycolatopsis sp. NBC_00438 TaxID=2903558 RepID=UPI002E1C61B7